MLLRIALLLGAVVISLQADENPSSALVPATYDFGSLDGFYDIGYHVSMGLIPKLGQDLLSRIANMILNSKDSSNINDVANDIVKANGGTITLMVLGCLLSFICIILFFSICCARCCCNSCGASKYQPVTESHAWLYIGTAVLVIAAAFLLTGTIIYSQSVDKSYHAIKDNALDVVDDLIKGAEDFVTDTNVAIQSALQRGITTTFSEVVKNLDNATDYIFDDFGTSSGLSVWENQSYIQSSEENAAAKLQTAMNALNALPPTAEVDTQTTITRGVQTAVSKLVNDLTPILLAAGQLKANTAQEKLEAQGKMNSTMDKAKNSLKKAESSVQDTVNTIDKTVQDVQKSLHDVEDTIKRFSKDVKDWNGLSPLKSGVVALGVVPASIALLFIFIGICGGFGRISRKKTMPHHRSGTSNCAGMTVAAGVYFILLLGAWVTIMAIAGFFGGFVVSSICKPVFRDDTYAVFNASEKFDFNTTAYDGQSISINLGHVFEKCSDSSMFSVLGGPQLVNADEVMKNIPFDQYTKEAQTQIDGIKPIDPSSVSPLNDHFQAAYKSFNTNTATFLAQTEFLPNSGATTAVAAAREDLVAAQTSTKQLQTVLEIYKKAMDKLQKAAESDGNNLKQGVANYFITIDKNTRDAVQSFVTLLDRPSTAPCKPLLTIYNNLGVLVCDKVGRPIHGAWVAIGLVALCFIPAALSLLCISRWLYRMDSHYYAGDHKRRSSDSYGLATDQYRSDVYPQPATNYRSQVYPVLAAPPVYPTDYAVDSYDPAPIALPRTTVPSGGFEEYKSARPSEEEYGERPRGGLTRY